MLRGTPARTARSLTLTTTTQRARRRIPFSVPAPSRHVDARFASLVRRRTVGLLRLRCRYAHRRHRACATSRCCPPSAAPEALEALEWPFRPCQRRTRACERTGRSEQCGEAASLSPPPACALRTWRVSFGLTPEGGRMRGRSLSPLSSEGKRGSESVCTVDFFYILGVQRSIFLQLRFRDVGPGNFFLKRA